MSDHLSRLEITNFRGFERLVLDDLADVNLIVGKNNSGKTALFEALVLLGEPCMIEDSLLINTVRGLAKVAGDTEETWGLLFHGGRLDRPVEIVGTTRSGARRELTLRMGQGTELYPERHERPTESKGASAMALLQRKAVRFDYRPSDGYPSWALATAFGGESVVIDSTPLTDPWMFPHPTMVRLIATAPDLYSQVVRNDLTALLLDGLRAVAPDISRLDLLTRAGQPTLFAALGDGHLLPLQVLGDGVSRVASWLLSMLTVEGKMVLIDEMENGIHYTVLPNVWQALLRTAQARNLQLFATTHSYEAIEALDLARQDPRTALSTTQLIRLDRLDADVVPVDYDDELLRAAVEMKAEVR